MDFRPFIEQVLQDASAKAVAHFGDVRGWAKDGDHQTVLTATDLAVGEFLVAAVQKTFPGHNVIDEEAGVVDRHSNYTWVIDPIDGTSNFAAGSPLYGTMIGLLENDIPVAGGLALPSMGEIYVAAKGMGTELNGKSIRVTDEEDLGKALVAVGWHAKSQGAADRLGHLTSSLIPRVLNLRSSASTFDMAMVAKGTYGAFVSSRGRIWDCVGPQIVVEEAGGVFTHFDGSRIDYANAVARTDQQFSYFMANSSLHKQLASIIRAIAR